MDLPRVVSREEWLVARKGLLAREKEHTRQRDALNAGRRGLPMVEIDKEYVFEGPDGEASLLDLFEGRRQLIVQHFMFDPEWDDGCPSCTYAVEDLGHLPHLHERDGNRVFHTYSAFARGTEHLVSTTMFLDLTPLGRQEGKDG